jgi:hypothetical protein
MTKGFVLPHLTSEELSKRDQEEMLLNSALSKCWRGDEFDGERAGHVLSDYAVRIFRVIHDVYRTRPTFQQDWLKEIEHSAVYRTLKVYSGFSAYGMPPLAELSEALRGAIRRHLENSRVVLLPPSAIERASSPLLAMVAETAREGPKTQALAQISIKPGAEIPDPDFAAELAKLLIEARWTPENVAEEINIDWRTVYRHRKGEIFPSLKTVWAYEEALSKRLNRKIKLPVPEKHQNASKTPAKRQ